MVIVLIISLLLLWLLLVSAALTEDDSGFVVTNGSFSGVANSLGPSGQQQPSPCCRCSLLTVFLVDGRCHDDVEGDGD
jgi:hypothetical protein